MKEACHNPIFICIFQFSLCVANDLKPFLKLFQPEHPLAFFLYEKVKEIKIALMTRFVRADVLASANSGYKLLKLDLKNESNLLPASSVKVGFGTNTELKKLKTIHHTNIQDVRSNTRKLLINLIEKTRECSPLAFKLKHYLSALSPTQIVLMSKTTLGKHFSYRFEVLFENKWMTSVTADKALNQYMKLIQKNDFVAKFKKFDIGTDRLDALYAGLLSNSLVYLGIWEVIKKCIVLSHGNARVEAGFFINESLLQENAKNASVLAQRIA